MRALAGLALALVALAGRGPAWASVTTYYQWREASGALALSEQPPPATVPRYSMHEVAVATPDARQKAAITRALARDRAALAVPAAPPEGGRVAAARTRLDDVRRMARLGRAPLPGERLGTVGGHSRLAPWYFARQRRLDEQVADANAALDEALRERDDARR